FSAVWQHPYLNVFKHFKVEEWKRSTKEGDVTTFMDKTLKGTVYRIRGSIPASNYIQLPKTSTQSLGLTGHYLYLLFKPMPGKYFVVHLDVTTEDSQVVRISFSNLFKEFKSTATWLQFPFICGAAKGSVYECTARTSKQDLVGVAPANVRWTCLMLDLHYILSMYLNRHYSYLKSIKLCSNLLVKNLYTSDLLFDPGVTFSEARQAKLAFHGISPMPREMAFPVPKGENWHDRYDYIRFPSDGSKLPYDSIQKGCSSPSAGVQVLEDPIRHLPRPVTLTKAVRDRVSLIQQITSPKDVSMALEVEVERQPSHFREKHETHPEGHRLMWGRGNLVDHWDVSCSWCCYSLGLTCFIQAGTFDNIFFFQRLLPDPILKLRTIIGFGGCSTKWALWTKNSSAVVYPCHAIIIIMQIETGEQRFFIGHTDKVSALAFNGNSTLLASAQMGHLSMVRLWDFQKGKCLSMFKTHVHSVSSLSLSYSGAVLCGIGKDGHGKTMVVVWNTAQVNQGGEVVVLAKAHTDVDIQTLKIAFFDDTRMVSCGRDNVRLWRVRSGALRSCPVNLGEYHSLEFTDLAFEKGHSAEREPEDRTLFVCSRSGHILEIDYKNVTIRNARRLLPSQIQHSHRREKQTFNSGPGIAINSISVSSTFCATASEDGYVRLWPLDFSAVFLEAEHEGPVSSVSISPDSLKVLCTTSTGNLGYLDVQSRGYNTLMRSHTDSVLAFSVDGLRKQMATVSQDNTIRIWDLVSMQQLYDFTASDEMPCTVVFHPAQQIFACGFSSGVVRTFSLAASDLLMEHKQHRGAVTGLTFSPDGNLMFSSCSHGTLALYNCATQKSHVLRVLGNVVSQDAEHSPNALALSGDGRLLAFVGPSKYTVTIMDAHSLDELLRIDVSILDLDSTSLDSALRICFASMPVGHLLVSTSSNKVLVLDAKTGRLVREVSRVHKLSCSSLALSEDARYLLTAGDRVVKVWDYQMRFDINFQVYIGHSEPVRQVSFTPDQQHVISIGDAIFLWDFLAVSRAESPTRTSEGITQSPFLFTETGSEKLKDFTSSANEIPRQSAPLPSLASPPCLDISSIHQAGRDGEKKNHLERRGIKVSLGKTPSIIQQLPWHTFPPPPPLPKWVVMCLTVKACERERETLFRIEPTWSILSKVVLNQCLFSLQSVLYPPAGNEGLKLKAVIGYNGNGRGNMVWNPDTGFFAYTCGCVIVVEDLHSGSQQHWIGHPEEISTLAVSHDAQVLASASGQGNGDSRCQIRIWNIQDGTCQKVIFHHETQVQAMAYSRDDRLLVTLGDYSDRTIALWNTHTYDLMSSTHFLESVHEVAFNPLSAGELACVGRGAVTFWLIEQRGADISLKVHRAAIPDMVGLVELTSLCYSTNYLLYSGTNTGQICVWDTQTNCCFMTWEADEGEIGVLLCCGNRLVSGSNTKRIRLWSVAAVQELRLKGSDARSSSVLLEHEMTLDGTIVGATFDDSLDMGIVGTTAGTLWYINWAESTSIRLISGHKNKVNEVTFSPGESHCATCGEDGSVRVWSLASMELVVQFQVLNQSCQCLAWSPIPISRGGAEGQHVVAGYSDGTIRVFSISRTEMELKMHPHSVALTAIAYSADGEIILSGGKDGLMAVSSPRTGMTIRVLIDHKGSPITVIQCTRKPVRPECGELWLAASSDRRVSVWVSAWLKDKCELIDWLSFPAPSSLPPSLAAFCPWDNGTLVYVGFGMQKEILFYSLRQKQVVEKIPLSHFATSLSLSPAAHFLAVGFNERVLRLIDCTTRTEQDFVGHDDSIHLCRFTPSGKRLFTASYNEILVWEITST
uniref:WD repeat-containing protein 90 n=1 Tax=Chelydra serpentina TaxID=8475 RepID=A0A8C3RXH5_CHESE